MSRWRISIRSNHTTRRLFFTCTEIRSRFSLHDPIFKDINVDEVISYYSPVVTKTFGFHDLIQFGRPPISDDHLVQNAQRIRQVILASLSRRIVALRNLPFIMMLNPNISTTYHKYLHSLHAVSTSNMEQIKSGHDNDKFVQSLEKVIEIHTDAIPTLAKGFAESQTYLSPAEVNAFLDIHLRDRIGTRLLAKHHIALTKQSKSNAKLEKGQVGMVDLALYPSQMIEVIAEFLADICDIQYGIKPSIQIDHGEDVFLAYVPEHMEYILTELLKNSFRASIEHHLSLTPSARNKSSIRSSQLSPVIITIVETQHGVQIRLSDRGGGIADHNLKRIWAYSESTFEEELRDDGYKTLNTPPPSVTGTGGSSMGGLGYGLPLSRAYAEYFGGNIELETAFDWGTDAYITLNGPKNQIV
ncbi:branched-chain alpha-ketoacid dehydrogenase [Lipomyces japonicus]|uniref:branched-chain alpha-ketoacid dehydrogenase n=1 Tax=Lipomyces japonicus TaxID=56871 RepID=UPI0034CEEE10